MKILVTLMLPFMADCIRVEKKNYDANEGGDVCFKCYYDPGYRDYTKYWCKGYYAYSCTILHSTRDHTVWKEDQQEGMITVKMKNLRKEDTDWYWCGIERSGLLDIMDYTHLTVAEYSTATEGVTATVNPLSLYWNGSALQTVLYYTVIPVLGLVVLLLVVTLTVRRTMRKKNAVGQNPKPPKQPGKSPDIFITPQSSNSESPVTYASIVLHSNEQPQECKTMDFPGRNQDGMEVEYSEISF